ncbi:MAG: hypothetical protein R2827_10325 [Bdellovibrionales bacterium]
MGESPVEINVNHDIILSERDGFLPKVITGWQATANVLKSLDQYSQIENTTSESTFQKIEFVASLEDLELSIEAHLVTRTQARSSLSTQRAFLVANATIEKNYCTPIKLSKRNRI